MASMNGISPASTGRHRSAASALAVVHRPRLDAPAADALPASAPLLVPSLCQIRIPGVSPRIAPPLLSSSSRPPALSAGCSASQGGATSEYQTGPFLCSEISGHTRGRKMRRLGGYLRGATMALRWPIDLQGVRRLIYRARVI